MNEIAGEDQRDIPSDPLLAVVDRELEIARAKLRLFDQLVYALTKSQLCIHECFQERWQANQNILDQACSLQNGELPQ